MKLSDLAEMSPEQRRQALAELTCKAMRTRDELSDDERAAYDRRQRIGHPEWEPCPTCGHDTCPTDTTCTVCGAPYDFFAMHSLGRLSADADR